MTNPSWPTLTEGKWNLVALNVVTGFIHRLKSNFTYRVTYKLTGEAAPDDTEAARDKSPKMFEKSSSEEIKSNQAIDVYVWPENSDKSVDSSPTDSIQVSI